MEERETQNFCLSTIVNCKQTFDVKQNINKFMANLMANLVRDFPVRVPGIWVLVHPSSSLRFLFRRNRQPQEAA